MQRDNTFDSASTLFRETAHTVEVNRRCLLKLSAGTGAALLAARAVPGLHASTGAQQGEDSPLSSGHTWHLTTADELRPEAPGTPTTAEIDELLEFQANRTDEMIATINRWAGRQAVLPWLEIGAEISDEFSPSALMDLRAQSLLTTAMNDAVVAAIDAQEANGRSMPAETDDRVMPIDDPFPAESSFPSLHAAVAGAATTVLAHLFPEGSTDGFAGLADEAATSRLWAGANFRSDIDAGLALGQAVGQLAVEYAQTDGTSVQWDGEGWPEGDGLYEKTPPDFSDPVTPLAGTWKTWVLPSGAALRPAPFPEYGSPTWLAELATVERLTAQRTLAQERTIDYWLNKGPKGFYTEYAQSLIARHQLGQAESAMLLSTATVAMFDALVAVWDAKYHYWTARPSTMNPEINLYIPNPPYPSYPGGFGAICAAGAGVLADIFPEESDELLSTAEEGAMIRAWCGIHYVLDNDVGLLIGGRTARATTDHIRSSKAA